MIIAVRSFESKLALARRLGATHSIALPYRRGQAIRVVGEPRPASEPVVAGLGSSGGVDYASKRVGLKKLAEDCFDCIKPGGTATIIGMSRLARRSNSTGRSSSPSARSRAPNMGSNRFRIDMLRYIDFYQQGRLNLDDMITRRGKLADVNEAFRAMKAGEVALTVVDVRLRARRNGGRSTKRGHIAENRNGDARAKTAGEMT